MDKFRFKVNNFLLLSCQTSKGYICKIVIYSAKFFVLNFCPFFKDERVTQRFIFDLKISLKLNLTHDTHTINEIQKLPPEEQKLFGLKSFSVSHLIFLSFSEKKVCEKFIRPQMCLLKVL